jgi:hypothetical protein
LTRQAGDGHEAAQALGDLVIARSVAIRPRLAEARDAAVDEPQVEAAQRLVIDAQPRLDVGAEILDHHVGLGDEALEDVDAARRLQVERERALVAVEILAIEAPAGEIALHVLARGDLDDPRPHVRELADGGGAGAGAGEVDHGIGRQRQRHFRAP